MDRDSAERLIAESFARPTCTPCTWRLDRGAYVLEQQANLRRCMIDPVQVQAVPVFGVQNPASQATDTQSLWAVARDEDHWLLFDPATATFSLAFGSSASNVLSMLGFSSGDALAEWLG